MYFQNSLTPRQRSAAFIALSDVLSPPTTTTDTAERRERFYEVEPTVAEVYAHLVTHGPAVAGEHWWLVIPLAAKLAMDAAAVDAEVVMIDFDALNEACRSERVADFTCRLAGFRPYQCVHRDLIWGKRGGTPRLGATLFSVSPDWAASFLDGVIEALEVGDVGYSPSSGGQTTASENETERPYRRTAKRAA